MKLPENVTKRFRFSGKAAAVAAAAPKDGGSAKLTSQNLTRVALPGNAAVRTEAAVAQIVPIEPQQGISASWMTDSSHTSDADSRAEHALVEPQSPAEFVQFFGLALSSKPALFWHPENLNSEMPEEPILSPSRRTPARPYQPPPSRSLKLLRRPGSSRDGTSRLNQSITWMGSSLSLSRSISRIAESPNEHAQPAPTPRRHQLARQAEVDEPITQDWLQAFHDRMIKSRLRQDGTHSECSSRSCISLDRPVLEEPPTQLAESLSRASLESSARRRERKFDATIQQQEIEMVETALRHIRWLEEQSVAADGGVAGQSATTPLSRGYLTSEETRRFRKLRLKVHARMQAICQTGASSRRRSSLFRRALELAEMRLSATQRARA